MSHMRFFLFIAIFLLAACPPKGGANYNNSAAWPKVNNWSTGYSGKNDIAIIIAIEDYAFLPPVPGARQSANDWENFFRKNKGMKDVFVLTDKNASIEEINRFVDSAVAETRADGSLWFVFVGHGAANPSGTDGLLIGMDANQSYQSIKARSLSRKDLQARLSNGRQKHSVLVLDACFSGRATDGKALVKGAQPVIVTSTPLVSSNMTILSAAKGSEIAGPLPNAKRPAFSYLLLGGLRGWADTDEDANVTTGELLNFTKRQLRVIPGRQQTPTIIGSSDMILSVGAGEKDPGIQSIITGGANPKMKAAAENTTAHSVLVTRGKQTGAQCTRQDQCAPAQGCIQNRCEVQPTERLKTVSFEGLNRRGFSFYGLRWSSPIEDWVKKIGIPNYTSTENSRLFFYLYNVKLGRDTAVLVLEVRSGFVSKINIAISEKFENKETRNEVFADGRSLMEKYLNRPEIKRTQDKAIVVWKLKDATDVYVNEKNGEIAMRFLNPKFYEVNRKSISGRKAESRGNKPLTLGIVLDRNAFGAKIQSVEANGPGAKMGLRVGDTIIKMDDMQIGHVDDVLKFMTTASGSQIRLKISRNGSDLLGKIQPIER